MTERRVVLMRHAKSSWKSDAPTDHARPLNKRGRRAAPKVALELKRLDWVPDLVLSSDSVRTTETWDLMHEAMGGERPVRFLPELYHGDTDDIRSALATVGESFRTVLVLGHNPGWEEALFWFSGRDEEMKTACAALLTKKAISWAEASQSATTWALAHFIAPRELE
ncbi:MAG: histidine phosphatase family protein [Myxococcota bacterium]